MTQTLKIACTILNAIEEVSSIPDLMWSDGSTIPVWNWYDPEDFTCNLCYKECENRIKKHFMWDIKEDYKGYINLSICYECYVKYNNNYNLSTHPSQVAVINSDNCVEMRDKEDFHICQT